MKHRAVFARSRLVAAALGSACFAAGVLGGAGCAALPDLDFPDEDATAPDGGGAPGSEGGPPAVDGGGDGSSGTGDSGSRDSGGGNRDAGSVDADDAGGGTCSVPTGVDAGCCPSGVAPCVGVACAHCTECEQAACTAGQYCCAKVNGSGYKGVSCVKNPGPCP